MTEIIKNFQTFLNFIEKKFHQFINFLSYKYKLSFEDVMKDYESFVKEERDNIIASSIEDDYKTFIDKEEDELEKKFNIKHNSFPLPFISPFYAFYCLLATPKHIWRVRILPSKKFILR